MATTDQRTPFDYLLNAMEAAWDHLNPASHGYGDKRAALFTYVRQQEQAGADALARVAALEAAIVYVSAELRHMRAVPHQLTPGTVHKVDSLIRRCERETTPPRVTPDTPGGAQ